MRQLLFSVEKCGDLFKLNANNTLLEMTRKGFQDSLDTVLQTPLPLEPGDRVDLLFRSDIHEGTVAMSVPNRSIPEIIRLMQNALAA
jgi:hypothetical protein